jgi:hypothetical protein
MRGNVRSIEEKSERTVNCLKCGKAIPYTEGRCPHCGYVEFKAPAVAAQGQKDAPGHEVEFDGSHLDFAICLAIRCHASQVDKAGQPYILHPLRVMNAVREEGEQAMIAAVLHDAVEDTDLTLNQVREHFGDYVASVVDALTRRKGQETYQEFIRRAQIIPLAAKIKIADLNDNLFRISSLPEAEQSIRKRYEKALAALGGPPARARKSLELLCGNCITGECMTGDHDCNRIACQCPQVWCVATRKELTALPGSLPNQPAHPREQLRCFECFILGVPCVGLQGGCQCVCHKQGSVSA